jgi:hypothetical protein
MKRFETEFDSLHIFYVTYKLCSKCLFYCYCCNNCLFVRNNHFNSSWISAHMYWPADTCIHIKNSSLFSVHLNFVIFVNKYLHKYYIFFCNLSIFTWQKSFLNSQFIYISCHFKLHYFYVEIDVALKINTTRPSKMDFNNKFCKSIYEIRIQSYSELNIEPELYS